MHRTLAACCSSTPGEVAADTARVLADLAGSNERAATWCTEVNAAEHTETCAVPADRLATEARLLSPLPSLRPSIGPAPTTRKLDRLSTIRLGSARYSVPSTLVGQSVTVHVQGSKVLFLDAATGQVHAEHPLLELSGRSERL